MKVYLVTVNSDQTEGKGIQIPDLVFSSEVEAQKYINSHGNYKSLYCLREFQVLDEFLNAEQIKNYKDRENALKKLTPREKELLGLN